MSAIRNGRLLRILPDRRPPGLPRFFFSSAEPQTFSLSRTLPHAPDLVYRVVSDIDSYAQFVPYCAHSQVTARDKISLQPLRATLKVGWNSFEESFESELKCEKPSLVIAQSHHSMFNVLHTKWRIFPLPSKDTAKVTLELKFLFSNALYNAVSASFAPTVANLMIEAFEKRIAAVGRTEKESTN